MNKSAQEEQNTKVVVATASVVVIVFVYYVNELVCCGLLQMNTTFQCGSSNGYSVLNFMVWNHS